MFPKRIKQAGQIRENLAKNAGVVAVIGPTLLLSMNALYKQTIAYGVHETKNPTKELNASEKF